jgi:ribosomal RNA-processing protein 1
MDLKSIAKSLADSESSTRSLGFARMRSYISSGFPVDQLPKVWKSLFYCNPHIDLWMADKLHEETVEEISSLYKSVQINHLLWFSSFLEMMRNEWEGIDPVRLDKFMLFVRYMLREVLPTAIESPDAWAEVLTGFIEKSVYKSQSLLFHLADILLDELPSCSFATKRKIIKPLITFMKSCKLNHLIDLVYNKILLKLVESKEEGLEKWLYNLATSK